MNKQIMSIAEVSRYLGFSQRKVYQLVKDEKIPVSKIGGQYRFIKDEIDSWLRNSKPVAEKSNNIALINRIKSIQDINKRRLYLIGLLTKKLEPEKVRPIIVGGCALEFYTTGGYNTADIDIICPSSELLDSILSKWGFKKEGRHWINSGLDMYIESPGSVLKGADPSKVTRVRIEDVDVYLIGIEDLIINRLNATVHWHSSDDRYWVKELIYIHRNRIDMDYLRKRAGEEKTAQEFDNILKEIPHENI